MEEIRATKLVFRNNNPTSFVSPILVRNGYQNSFDNNKYTRSYLNNDNKQLLPAGLPLPYSSYVPSYLNTYGLGNNNKTYTRGITNSTDYLNRPYTATFQTAIAPYSSYKNLDTNKSTNYNSWVGSQNESCRTSQDYLNNVESKPIVTGKSNTQVYSKRRFYYHLQLFELI